MRWRLAAVWVLSAAAAGAGAASAQAQTATASLDRDRIALGETVTLSVEVSDANAAMPDWSPLASQFVLTGHSSRRRHVVQAGAVVEQATYAVTLQPRNAGVLEVPAIRVAGDVTAPLRLRVMPARDPGAAHEAQVFIEIEAAHGPVYVQQDLGYVLKLHFALPLYSGQIDVPEPPGTRWQRAGSDLEYQRDVDGQRFSVLERRYVFTPERSGRIDIPAPVFSGRSVGMYSSTGPRQLRAEGEAVEFDVQAIPDGAARPWRPLHDLQLAYLETPSSSIRVGEPFDIVIEAVVDGSHQIALDALEIPAIPGVQIFPEPTQGQQRFEQGRPQVHLTRRFTLVPTEAGELRIPGLALSWWNVTTGSNASARLQDLAFDVWPAARVVSLAEVDEMGLSHSRNVGPQTLPWIVAAVVLGSLWLATVALLLWRRFRPTSPLPPRIPATGMAAAHRKMSVRQLRSSFDADDPANIARRLCALATPPAIDLDELKQRLADPGQVAAVDGLQRALWGGGNVGDARERLRTALGGGIRWTEDEVSESEAARDLPPLYPPGLM